MKTRPCVHPRTVARRRAGWLLAFVLAVLPTFGSAQYRLKGPVDLVKYPDIVVYNGKVLTMDDTSLSDKLGTIAEAMAVRDGYVVGIGTSADLLKAVGPKTLKIDLKGKTVMPGFIDTHVHINMSEVSRWFEENPQAWNEVARSFSASGNTVAELTNSIRIILTQQMKGAPPGVWARISLPRGLGAEGDFATRYLTEKHITLKDLDKWSPNNPVMLQSETFMTNTAGLKALPDMLDTGGDPPAVPDEDGLGNMRYYNSMMYVNKYFHSAERVKLLAEIMKRGLERSAADGITTHGSSLEGLRFWDAFKHLALQGPMPIRSGFSLRTVFYDNMDAPGLIRRLGDLEQMGTPYMWPIGLTYGSMDAGGLNICTSMEGRAEVKAMQVCKATSDRNGPSMIQGMYWAVRNRHRLALGHSSGDKAVDFIMDEIEQAIKDDPGISLEYVRSRHYTTDHCTYYPRPAQIPRLARLGFVVSCQGDLDNRVQFLERNFNRDVYQTWLSPIKSMVDAGMYVTFESGGGGPVTGGPGRGHLAGGTQLMTRKTSDGKDAGKSEAIDRHRFLKMVTSWASVFMGKPNEIGTLEVGKFADFVIMNRDPATVTIEELQETRPLMTVVGGSISFLRQEYAQELGLEPVGPQYKYDLNAPRQRGVLDAGE